MLSLFKTKRNIRSLSSLQFTPLGFHGDEKLISLVDWIIDNHQIEYFIETGTNVGSTLNFISNKYSHLKCFSCEPDSQAYPKAIFNIGKDNPNVRIFNLLSQDFIQKLQEDYVNIFDKKVLFWLDAHGYGFEWPLREEVAFITEHFTNAFILIDDFIVPGKEMFGYDVYMDQECSFMYIQNYIKTKNFKLYYPNYTEKTSQHHPLRGWGLLRLGEALVIPESMEKIIIKAN